MVQWYSPNPKTGVFDDVQRRYDRLGLLNDAELDLAQERTLAGEHTPVGSARSLGGLDDSGPEYQGWMVFRLVEPCGKEERQTDGAQREESDQSQKAE